MNTTVKINIVLLVIIILSSFAYSWQIERMQTEMDQLNYKTSLQIKQRDDALELMGQDLTYYRTLSGVEK